MSRLPEIPSQTNGVGAREATYVDTLAKFFTACYGEGVIELRAPKTAEGTRFGFFKDYTALARQSLALSGTAPGIYTTVNCVNGLLLARAPDYTVVQQGKLGVARDEDIARLTTLLIDVDPVRQKDMSATNQEHADALGLAGIVQLSLKEEYCWPDPVVIDSGNGVHLRYRIDLENTPDNVALLKAVLASLSGRFSDDRIRIDTVTYNPSRVAKIPYTLAAKGEATNERPHRVASVLRMPAGTEPVDIGQLKAAGMARPKQEGHSSPAPPRTPHNGSARQESGLLEKALKNNKFFRLWHGDTSMHSGDDSVADQALCCELVFWFGSDAGIVDALFRQSGLYRDKWEREDYRRATIQFALDRQTEHYDPGRYKERPQQPKPGASVFTWKDVPCVFDLEAHVSWIVEELIPESAVTLITGDSGHGKTILATALAGKIVTGRDFLGYRSMQRKVLYMDRENSLGVVKQHLRDLKIERTNDLIIWGGWCKEGPDTPAAASLIEFARDEHPVMIFDSLIAFHTGDEQSATDTRKYLQLYRRLAEEGATVIVLHHTGKSEGARQYRGSSDIKASVDVAWFLEKLGDPSGLLKDMRLVGFKNRMGGGTTVPLTFHDGDFQAAQDRPESDTERLEKIVASNPGQGTRTLIDLAKVFGISKNRVLDLLKEGAMGDQYEVRKLGPNRYGYYVKEVDLGL